MDSLNSVLDRYKENKSKDKPAPHEKAAAVNEIIRVLGEDKVYNYAYWLKKVGTASYSQVLAIVKEAEKMEKKYRGGFVTNQLKPFQVKKVAKKVTPKKNESTDTK